MNNLLDNISILFKKYGVKSVSMDDIARDLGMSKKTLYQHYKNKDDVIDKVANYEFEQEMDELEKLFKKHKHVINQLYAVSKFIIKSNLTLNPSLIYSMEKYYQQTWEELINKRKEFVLNLINKNFKEGIKQGIYRRDINLDVIQLFYSFLLNIKSIEIFNDRSIEKFDATFNTIFNYHIRGIASNVGIEYLEEQFLKEKKQEQSTYPQQNNNNS